MAPAENHDPHAEAVYVGRFLHNVAGHRVKLPSKWRQANWPTRFMILPWRLPHGDRLMVLTPARWRQMLESLQGYSLSDDDAEAGESLVCAAVSEAVLDSSGRLSLPVKAAARVGIERRVELVGRIDKFELWDPNRFEAVAAGYEARAAEIFKKLRL